MHSRFLHTSLSLLSLGLLASACASDIGGSASPSCDDGACDEGNVRAVCEAVVVGKGRFDTELEYLPRVLACENGDGSLESLKAQAISARSYLYYKMQTSGSVLDGQGDQVFSCNRTPALIHKQAVEATSGQILRYRGTQVAAFYVAGALQSGPSCTGGTNDPTSTERFVTYNEGLSGSGIAQSRLGLRDPSNHANRGCMSQNGANCLADVGATAEEILTFYYGADIDITQANGSCVVSGGGGVGGGDDEPSSDAWIGTDCADDQLICDFEADGQSAECMDWFDAGTQQLHGFCSIGCEGFCPDKFGEPSTFCAEIDSGSGNCVVEPTSSNNFCGDIGGAVAQVVPRYVGTSGAPVEYTSVCAPPGNATQCETAEGQPGECVDTDTMQCGGTLHTGFCPGGSNIVCCTR